MADLSLGRLPSYQCYDCQVCGACCGGYLAVAVTPAEAERILAQGWKKEPDLAHGRYFTIRGTQLYMAHRADGRCIFLDDEHRCRIHAKFGEPAKPLSCRLYPFIFVPAGNEYRLDIRFDCPEVAGSRGRPLTGHRAAAVDLLPQVVPGPAGTIADPPFLNNMRLDWARLHRLAGAFATVLQDTRLDMTRRVVCAVNLAAALDNPRMGGLEMAALDDLLKKAVGKLSLTIADDQLPRVAPAGGTALMFRQLLAVYGRRDGAHEKGQVWRRLSNSLRMVRGAGQVPPLRSDLPTADFRALEASFGIPDNDTAAALLRYYRLRLENLSFCGRAFYQRSFIDGVRMLLLTYPITLWFARFYAAAEEKAALDASSVERALMIVDHVHGRTPLLNVGAERFRQRALCERSQLRSLVIWYGS